MKSIPSHPCLPGVLDPFLKLRFYGRADNSDSSAFYVEGASGIRGRIPHTQVVPHNWEAVSVLEEAARMFKAILGEIPLAQLFL